MATIKGLTTVNGGEIFNCNGFPDPFYSNHNLQVEILRPENHNPNTQIICYYYWDTEKAQKVEVTLYRDIHTGSMGSEVYRFRSMDSLQHYYSRNYKNFIGMPRKYYDIVQYIHPIFIKIFG